MAVRRATACSFTGAGLPANREDAQKLCMWGGLGGRRGGRKQNRHLTHHNSSYALPPSSQHFTRNSRNEAEAPSR